ncbi:MAG: Spx/MgsR family RNA polymerase-binding regulatory protein [Neisseriaceae bacterium]|nr:Spx/MgsR family RNA polymerase-binding regulatory protein [Neisseriaceae bacterium]
MITLFGIPQCKSVQKACAWLDQEGLTYQTSNFKKTPPTATQIRRWIGVLGKDVLINRKGTTFRNLSQQEKDLCQAEDAAIELIIQYPSIIKRPLIEWENGTITVGFDPELFAQQA